MPTLSRVVDVVAQFLVYFMVLMGITLVSIGALAVWEAWNVWMDRRATRKKEDDDLW